LWAIFGIKSNFYTIDKTVLLCFSQLVARVTQNVNSQKRATTSNASTLATSKTLVQSTLNATHQTTKLNAGVHLG
jgi:hypothetical protein